MCPQCSSSEVTRNETGQNICAKCGHVFDDIHFECPQCHKPMAGPAELINIQMDCPDCGHPFKPTPGPASGAPAALAVTPAKIKRPFPVLTVVIVLLVVAGVGLTVYLRGRFNEKPSESVSHKQDRWRQQCKDAMTADATNRVSGFTKLVDVGLNDQDATVSHWTGQVTLDFINHLGGIDRTNLYYKFVFHQYDVSCYEDITRK